MDTENIKSKSAFNRGIEKTAIETLKKGIQLDTAKRYTEALACYQDGLQTLVFLLKDQPSEVGSSRRIKLVEYLDRAEAVKGIIQQLKESGQFHEMLHISLNSTGHGYNSVFGRFLDNDVSIVIIDDPNIKTKDQCLNFLRLIELLVTKCTFLSRIELMTSKDTSGNSKQGQAFNEIINDLKNYKVELSISYSEAIKESRIITNSGWIIKLGRGLDYFKPVEDELSFGYSNLNVRECLETTISITFSKKIKQSFGNS